MASPQCQSGIDTVHHCQQIVTIELEYSLAANFYLKQSRAMGYQEEHLGLQLTRERILLFCPSPIFVKTCPRMPSEFPHHCLLNWTLNQRMPLHPPTMHCCSFWDGQLVSGSPCHWLIELHFPNNKVLMEKRSIVTMHQTLTHVLMTLCNSSFLQNHTGVFFLTAYH